MTENAKLFIESVVFIVVTSGIFFRMKFKIDANKEELNALKESMNKKTDAINNIKEKAIAEIHHELVNCKITEEKVKSLDRAINIFSSKLEKNFDELRSTMGKIFEKLERKVDK